MFMPKLLIVDDEVATVDMLSTYLKLLGHEPIGAYNGTDGLVLVEVEKPELLILDLMMPDIDGFEVCKRIRAHAQFGKLPVIVISARADKAAIEKALSAGANVYLTKPVDLSKLSREIKQLLATPD
jgi:CheY-like chemotaxis protein